MQTFQNKNSLRVLGWPAYKFKTINAYNWLLYKAVQDQNVDVTEFSVKQLLTGSYDILHIHWPEQYLGRKNTFEAIFKTLAVFLLLWIAKLRGTKIIWTAHNFAPHNEYHPLLVHYFWMFFPGFLDGVICLSEYSQNMFPRIYPNLKGIKSSSHLFGMGNYKDVFVNAVSHEQARQELGIPENAFVFLFLGHIIPYKNVPALARNFQDLMGDDKILLIAGRPSSESLASELNELASQDHRIRLHLDYVPDEKIQLFLNSSDLVVFPFQNMLNSSSVMMALTFNKPVLVPHFGSLIDLKRLFGSQWIHTYQDSLTPVELAKAENSVDVLSYENTDLRLFGWRKIATETIEFYERVLQEKQ